MPAAFWTNLYITCTQWQDDKDKAHSLATNGIRIFCMKSLDIEEYPQMFDYDINGRVYDIDCVPIAPKVLSIEIFHHSLTHYEISTLRHAYENRYALIIYDRNVDDSKFSGVPEDTEDVETFPYYYQYSAKILQMPAGLLSPYKMVAGTYVMKFVIDSLSTSTIKVTPDTNWSPKEGG